MEAKCEDRFLSSMLHPRIVSQSGVIWPHTAHPDVFVLFLVSLC